VKQSPPRRGVPASSRSKKGVFRIQDASKRINLKA
jgi:hypothetical protein